MVVWGATPAVSKVAVEEIDPVLVGVMRTVLAGLLAAPLLLALREPLPATRHGRLLLALSGASGFVVFPILFTAGQERTSATHGAMLLAALPVVTGAYAALVERRRPGIGWLVGCAIAVAGELGLILGRAGGDEDAGLGGDLMIAASVLVVAVGYVAGARLGQAGYGSLATTLWGVALSAVVVTPLLAALLGSSGWPEAGAGAWSSVVFLAVVTTILGYVGWYWALARGGIGRIATMQFLQPISGLALAALLLGEAITAELAAAGAVILLGVWIAQRR
jgi:drug/metabolite transporter (DMT)-like permease